ncbi:MAG TPA: bifunctional adenosylcobinamide kinase/adenosylcobinamide-phosphate guanylyltransferase [Xanthomonadaceae bacterium]|nr:bifunctional adenosylcobinamide kinase/adenosylcobinamide-phosphate guanylyltransferase [Xanthomonadaceae bacterium]
MPEDSGPKIVLVVGGVRSGKSRYAQELAMRGQRVAFLATAEARDDDMRQRIARHREERPGSWTTFEAPVDLEQAVTECGRQYDTLLIDCLTLWVSNLMERERDHERVLARAERLAQALRETPCSVILVSNEVGSGIVPESELGRSYRDLLGFTNQRVAAAADEVILLVAGCPLIVKQAMGARA